MWITSKQAVCQETAVYRFQKTFMVQDQSSAKLTVRVSAEARYKLYLNGTLVSLGPCKGNEFARYYETVDLASYLVQGENILYADVLQLEEQYGAPVFIVSVERTGRLAFFMDGTLCDSGEKTDLSTKTPWQVCRLFGPDFTMAVYSAYSGLFEKTAPIRTGEFSEAIPIGHTPDANIDHQSVNNYGEFCTYPLYQRPIPQLFRKPREFVSAMKPEGGNPVSFTVPANTTYTCELNAGELTTGYLTFSAKGGKDAEMKVLYSECYEHFDGKDYSKNLRDDKTGILRGDFDIFLPDGSAYAYETYWFRTFRFIQVTITTKEEPLTIEHIGYIETGYPFEVTGEFSSSDPTHQKMLDVSIRTLQRCMHETFEDCPYYEQLQYTMDSRLQMLFSYQLSADDRLARRCMEDYHASKIPEGLLQSRTPCIRRQIIPQFSLHFTFMVEDHLLYYGDVSLAKRYLPTIDAVLNWFDSKRNAQGLVGKTGYWSYIDWVDGWTLGVPTAEKSGALTVVNFIYATALNSAAHICEMIGRSGDDYRKRAKEILRAAKMYCYDSDRNLYTDGPGVRFYSTHAQLWAVLAGAENPKALLSQAFADNLAKPSYSMCFFLFRALEKAGMYDLVEEKFDAWRLMLDKHCTTWVEDDVRERSECHGWGSTPVYEFAAMRLGVRPVSIGYGEIQIAPYTKGLSHAEGTVASVKGDIHVKWEVKDGIFSLWVDGPAYVTKKVVLPNGDIFRTTDAAFHTSCEV